MPVIWFGVMKGGIFLLIGSNIFSEEAFKYLASILLQTSSLA
jgi:hypothetical protein